MTVSQLFNSQTKTIAFAAGLLVLSSLVSRVLGIVRNGLLSWQFGAGETTDIYLAAFRIPDFLYGILIMGGISTVFLPLFSDMFQKKEKQAWAFVSNLFNVLVGALLGFSTLAFLLAPFLIDLVAPGFSESQKQITVALTRLMLLSPILLGVSSIFSGVLQYFGKFFTYSLAPIFYNLGIITGILFLAPLFGIWGLGFGVVIGALLHVAIQVPAALSSGFRWQPLFDWKEQAIGKVFRLALPRTFAAAGLHMNIIVLTALASTISTGSITIFTYADDVQHFPIGLIGVSFAIAAFPSLSRLFAERQIQQFKEAFATTLRQILFLVVPISLLVFLLRAQIVRLVYGAGDKFTWSDTRLAAAALGIFAFGIVFQALIPFLARTFFAVQNTKTPTFISIASVMLNIFSAVFFVSVLATPNTLTNLLILGLKLQGVSDIRVLALPLALVLSGTMQAVVLFVLLQRYVKKSVQRDLYVSVAKIGIASAVLATVTYGIMQVYGGVFSLTTYEEVLGQFVLASLGGALAFIVASFLLKSPEMLYFSAQLRTRLTKKR